MTTPDFAAWKPENLVRYATDTTLRIIELEEALTQLREDLHAAMELIRKKDLQHNG